MAQRDVAQPFATRRLSFVEGAGERRALPTAIARSRPAAICESTAGMLLNSRETWPDITSAIAGAVPLYGICTMSIFAIDFSSSMPMWFGLPGPTDA